MTKHLQDVLADIASDAGPVDLLDRVRGETRALRWRRRAVVGAGALGVAGAVAVGAALVNPAADQPTDPAETAPPASPLPAELDLIAATAGGVESASLVIVSGFRLFAADATTDEVVRIYQDRPVTGEVQLSADGSQVVLTEFVQLGSETTATQHVSVIDLATGETVFSERPETTALAGDDAVWARFALSPDGASLVTARPDTEGLDGTPTLELIDIASTEVTTIDYSALADRRGAADPLPSLAWSPDGSRLALNYLNAEDIIEMPSGAILSSQAGGSSSLTPSPWSADSSRLLKASWTSASTWLADPAVAGGQAVASSRLIGEPLGFAGPDLLLWLVDGDQLVVTTLDGEAVGVSTTIVSDAPVDTVASALATAAD